MKEEYKIHSDVSTTDIQQWLKQFNTNDIVEDSIRIKCDSVDNSVTGVIFTIILKLKIKE
jgi:hypothetical protein